VLGLRPLAFDRLLGSFLAHQLGGESLQVFQVAAVVHLPLDEHPVAVGSMYDVLVFEPDARLDHLPERVELGHGLQHDAELKLPDRHLVGLVDHVVPVVLAPVEGGYAVLGNQVVVKRRAGQRGEDYHLGGVDLPLDGRPDGLHHGLPVVLLGAQHEHAVGLDLVLVQYLDGLAHLFDGLALFVFQQGLGIDRFEADVENPAARVMHELHKLGVLGHVQAALGGPGEG